MLKLMLPHLRLRLPHLRSKMTPLLRALIAPILVSIGAIFFIIPAYAENFPLVGRINDDAINVRSGPNTNFERIDQLPKGSLIVIYAHQFEWYQLQLLSTAESYIRADYIKMLKDDVGEVIGDRVNVRARPNSEAAAITQLTQGALVRVKSTANNWVKIVAPKGSFGWVHQKFVEITPNKVTDDLLPQEIMPALQGSPVVTSTPPVKEIEITARGFIKPAVNAPNGQVQYQLFVNDKPVYYLLNAPNVGQFSTRQVQVKGILKPSMNPNDLPTLQVSNISLVL